MSSISCHYLLLLAMHLLEAASGLRLGNGAEVVCVRNYRSVGDIALNPSPRKTKCE